MSCKSKNTLGNTAVSVIRVVHVFAPRSLSQYVQEIGRRGQAPTTILYYSKPDIASVGIRTFEMSADL